MGDAHRGAPLLAWTPHGQPCIVSTVGLAYNLPRWPTADVEIGHRSISVCHLANITRWVGRRLKWDPAQEVFLNDDEANRFADRPRRKGYEMPASA